MSTSPSITNKLLAISGTIALIISIGMGFVFDAWAWAWVVFLVPGLIRTWQAVGQGNDSAVTQGHGAGRPGVEGDEPRKPTPPPQRYEG